MTSGHCHESIQIIIQYFAHSVWVDVTTIFIADTVIALATGVIATVFAVTSEPTFDNHWGMVCI